VILITIFNTLMKASIIDFMPFKLKNGKIK
jgi:hypothetical protein